MTFRAFLVAVMLLPVLPIAAVYGHGDGAPQPVDTSGLPPLGEQWLATNPYRNDEALRATAIEIGSRGYNSNCARCHGLEVKSGGMAPDLRELGEGESEDAWFIARVLGGATVGGRQKMPPFDGLLNQEAIWAIRTYIDSQPE
ncbi:cytochrome c-550 PedF [Hyphomicrobium sulfonivorans]|uniref:Cytochrome C550 (Soluble cytochrome C) n=1 Tax=Hyphomicrobium sulfonivorans TaxID=121290 RepID=A0A109BIG6_HYPSL|nr:cytochrome c-550 PedF [Hyphomicrobium sulfonivorans]KWT69423.1 Cytochrome C550 (Soluble cytochrome C) [Hyphomicrobium sulfonivorans]MBI1651031.1 cytochrome c-550 PedF [Hyphomicrobium sulfonivorans]NSL72586.1 cytochrome c-550 PedF [Hyphomicrobium sulfonivorans]